MDRPLVSILMPVYNSFDYVRSENKNLLPLALDSLLKQTYKNFELIILDNQSTDDTQKICQQYADKDERIRYILDTQKRYPEGGITQAATFSKGTYIMIANDDDLWDSSYIEKMLRYLEKHPKIDMCYSNGSYIDIEGKIIDTINTPRNNIYSSSNSPLSNFSNYILKRNPIPLAFGLFRAEAYRKTLPFEDFDILKADVDNLFVSKFFLLGLKCHYLDDPLFFYRKKQRVLDPNKVEGMPSHNNKDLIGLYYLNHQFSFLNKLRSIINLNFHPNANQKDFLNIVLLQALFIHSEGLTRWLLYQAKQDNKNRVILTKSADQYKKIVSRAKKAFPHLGNFKQDDYDNIRFEPLLNFNLINLYFPLLKELESLLSNFSTSNEILKELKNAVSIEISQMSKRQKELKQKTSEIPEILIKDLNTKPNGPSIIKPTVTVITTSMNLAHLVEETIRSISNQSTTLFEHIVIDGGSTDNTFEILKKFPHIKLISEKDQGYPDALWKGLNIAQGDYIMQCAISDGYATTDWVKKCIETLNSNPDISLVWGLPGRLTEKSKMNAIARPQFHYDQAPDKERMFNYWLKTFFVYPEGNLCVRKKVALRCYPSFEDCQKNILDWLEFSYRFNYFGYLSAHIPVVANFGRTHGGQLGEKMLAYNNLKNKHRNFKNKIWIYRWQLILGLKKHKFINEKGKETASKFDRKIFIKEYAAFKTGKIFKINSKYLQPKKYVNYFKKNFIKKTK